MPLTPAHAAMAWPLSVILRQVPITALVIGTLSPDFEYLLRLAPRGEFGHSLAGMVVFCVPVSLTVWALFERFGRGALARTLPPMIGEALAGRGAQRALSRTPSSAGHADPAQSRRGWWTVAVLIGGSVLGAILNAARVLERGVPQIFGYAAVGAMVGIVLATIAIVVSASIRGAARPERR